MTTITIEMANRLRFLRGIVVPIGDDVVYETTRLETIIKRQAELFAEMQLLDQELLEMKVVP